MNALLVALGTSLPELVTTSPRLLKASHTKGIFSSARILMMNPFGKYRRDNRYRYVQTTVSKLMGGNI